MKCSILFVFSIVIGVVLGLGCNRAVHEAAFDKRMMTVSPENQVSAQAVKADYVSALGACDTQSTAGFGPGYGLRCKCYGQALKLHYSKITALESTTAAPAA